MSKSTDDSDDSQSDEHNLGAVDVRTVPPATPTRRSSLNARPYIRSLDGQVSLVRCFSLPIR